MSSKLCRELKKQVDELQADLDSRRAAEQARIEELRTKLPTDASELSEGQQFMFKEMVRTLVKLPDETITTAGRCWFSKATVEKKQRWIIMGDKVMAGGGNVFSSLEEVLTYMKNTNYRRK